METMEFLSKKPLLITDTILRDAGQGSLHDAAVLLGGLDGLLQVPHVVEGVEDADRAWTSWTPP